MFIYLKIIINFLIKQFWLIFCHNKRSSSLHCMYCFLLFSYTIPCCYIWYIFFIVFYHNEKYYFLNSVWSFLHIIIKFCEYENHTRLLNALFLYNNVKCFMKMCIGGLFAVCCSRGFMNLDKLPRGIFLKAYYF